MGRAAHLVSDWGQAVFDHVHEELVVSVREVERPGVGWDNLPFGQSRFWDEGKYGLLRPWEDVARGPSMLYSTNERVLREGNIELTGSIVYAVRAWGG